MICSVFSCLALPYCILSYFYLSPISCRFSSVILIIPTITFCLTSFIDWFPPYDDVTVSSPLSHHSVSNFSHNNFPSYKSTLDVSFALYGYTEYIELRYDTPVHGKKEYKSNIIHFTVHLNTILSRRNLFTLCMTWNKINIFVFFFVYACIWFEFNLLSAVQNNDIYFFFITHYSMGYDYILDADHSSPLNCLFGLSNIFGSYKSSRSRLFHLLSTKNFQHCTYQS